MVEAERGYRLAIRSDELDGRITVTHAVGAGVTNGQQSLQRRDIVSSECRKDLGAESLTLDHSARDEPNFGCLRPELIERAL